MVITKMYTHHIYLKYSDKLAKTNSVDPDQTATSKQIDSPVLFDILLTLFRRSAMQSNGS